MSWKNKKTKNTHQHFLVLGHFAVFSVEQLKIKIFQIVIPAAEGIKKNIYMKKMMTRVTTLLSVSFSFLFLWQRNAFIALLCRCCTCPCRAAHVNTFKANTGWYFIFPTPPSSLPYPFHLLIFIPLLIAELYTGLFGLSNYLKGKLKKKKSFSVCIWIEVKN